MLVPADTFNRQTIRACESKMIWLRVSHDGLEAAAQGYLLPACCGRQCSQPADSIHSQTGSARWFKVYFNR
jgi:hypothetical protein